MAELPDMDRQLGDWEGTLRLRDFALEDIVLHAILILTKPTSKDAVTVQIEH